MKTSCLQKNNKFSDTSVTVEDPILRNEVVSLEKI